MNIKQIFKIIMQGNKIKQTGYMGINLEEEILWKTISIKIKQTRIEIRIINKNNNINKKVSINKIVSNNSNSNSNNNSNSNSNTNNNNNRNSTINLKNTKRNSSNKISQYTLKMIQSLHTSLSQTKKQVNHIEMNTSKYQILIKKEKQKQIHM